MQNFKVRTYDVRTRLRQKPQFLFLTVARNAGKPLQDLVRTALFYTAADLEEMENVYWTFYALWKHGFFHPYFLRKCY